MTAETARMFTGSITVNRVTVALQPTVRQDLYDEARRHGMKVPEMIRYILLRWYEERRGATAKAEQEREGRR